MVGIGIALLVPVLASLNAIITRKLRYVHYSVLVFWFAVGGQVVATIFICTHDTKWVMAGSGCLICPVQAPAGRLERPDLVVVPDTGPARRPG
jgi:hypothetical protein